LQALDQYKNEIRNREFPTTNHTYDMPENELLLWDRWNQDYAKDPINQKKEKIAS